MSIILSGNLLNLKEVIEQTRMSKTSIYNAIKLDGFPKPVINRGKSLWHVEHVEAYLQRIANQPTDE